MIVKPDVERRGYDRRCCSADGRSKRTFATREEAKREARRNGYRDVRPYQCPLCGSWHNGHRPGARA